jgi:hypothetical protein
MNNKILIILTLSVAGICSCSSSRSTSVNLQTHDTLKTTLPRTFVYNFYMEVYGTETTPHDKIWIDSSGQMRFDHDQLLKNGAWKPVHGLAYLDPKDEDAFLSFIKNNYLYTIHESDITPQCATGEQFVFRISRSDLQQVFSAHTNSCASEYNLLTGEARKLFTPFLEFIQYMRKKYRPEFTN